MTEPAGARSGEPDPAVIDELVIGNRILSQQKVVDAFGHISVRHDKDPSRYVMARHLAPGLVTKSDLIVFDLDSNPVSDKSKRYYSERFIHGEIYKARPDVVSVVHCHAPELIPFGVVPGRLLQPIFHMSGFLGGGVVTFDIRGAAGMTNMLIRTPELGRALAKTLANHPVALMRGHGATLVGRSIKQVVFRAVYAALNARLQMDALRLGQPIFLADEEAQKAAEANDGSLDRAWSYWKHEAMGDEHA
jgi:HCOMODA/2-hydroxy-3-carboxy-muconic semialdehyde decarboxylase